MSDRIGGTDLSNRAIKVYLVKMPNFLAQQFANPEGIENNIIGRLRIPEEETLGPAAVTDAEDDDVAAKKELPRIFLDKTVKVEGAPERDVSNEYELMFQPDDPKITVFSGKPVGDNVDMRVEGQVSFQCVARPKYDATYQKMNQSRTIKAAQKSRVTLHMDDSSRKAADRVALKPTAMAETTKQREERRKTKEDAKRHLDVPDEQWREMAKVCVFKAFEGQAHYSMEQLAKDVHEPSGRLRSIINEVCTYNKSGPFSGKYELKDEFKTIAQRQQKDRELEDYELAKLDVVRKRREERAEREKDAPPSKKPRSI